MNYTRSGKKRLTGSSYGMKQKFHVGMRHEEILGEVLHFVEFYFLFKLTFPIQINSKV